MWRHLNLRAVKISPKFAVGALYLIAATLLYLYQPDRSGQLVDLDEGLQGIGAVLYNNGRAWHREIWSDQPVLLPVLFSWTFYLFPPTIETGRMLVVVFGAALLVNLSLMVRRDKDALTGFITAILLLSSARFIRFSGALMQGVPSLSFSVASLVVLMMAKPKSRWPARFSGILFGLAVATKLFVAVLLPVFSVIFLFRICLEYRQHKSVYQNLMQALSWTVCLSMTLLSLAAIFAPALFTDYGSQLFEAHQQLRGAFSGDQLPVLSKLASADRWLFALAALGLISGIIFCDVAYLVPGVWFFSAILSLRHHHPIWVHHYLLYSIPAVWLAGLAISEIWYSRQGTTTGLNKWSYGLKRSRDLVHTFFVRPIICVVALWVFITLPNNLIDKYRTLDRVGVGINSKITARLAQLKPQITCMIADLPIYAFINRIPVVPELGIISLKRLESGQLKNEEIISLVKLYRPEAILAARFPKIGELVTEQLKGEYVYDTVIPRLLIRSDLQRSSSTVDGTNNSFN